MTWVVYIITQPYIFSCYISCSKEALQCLRHVWLHFHTVVVYSHLKACRLKRYLPLCWRTPCLCLFWLLHWVREMMLLVFLSSADDRLKALSVSYSICESWITCRLPVCILHYSFQFLKEQHTKKICIGSGLNRLYLHGHSESDHSK